MANFQQSDVEQNRVLGGLGYLIFFLPLIGCKDSKFGRYCANQGLLLWIAYIIILIAFAVLTMILGWVPVLGWIIRTVRGLAVLAVGVFMVYYTYLACAKGDARQIPFIGSYTIIK